MPASVSGSRRSRHRLPQGAIQITGPCSRALRDMRHTPWRSSPVAAATQPRLVGGWPAPPRRSAGDFGCELRRHLRRALCRWPLSAAPVPQPLAAAWLDQSLIAERPPYGRPTRRSSAVPGSGPLRDTRTADPRLLWTEGPTARLNSRSVLTSCPPIPLTERRPDLDSRHIGRPSSLFAQHFPAATIARGETRWQAADELAPVHQPFMWSGRHRPPIRPGSFLRRHAYLVRINRSR